MSDQDQVAARAWEACEAAIKSIDASLSVLVVARDNVVAHMRELQELRQPARNPTAVAGQVPDPDCEHVHRTELPGGAELCDDCGEQV